jgi:hypothetical protein
MAEWVRIKNGQSTNSAKTVITFIIVISLARQYISCLFYMVGHGNGGRPTSIPSNDSACFTEEKKMIVC